MTSRQREDAIISLTSQFQAFVDNFGDDLKWLKAMRAGGKEWEELSLNIDTLGEVSTPQKGYETATSQINTSESIPGRFLESDFPNFTVGMSFLPKVLKRRMVLSS